MSVLDIRLLSRKSVRLVRQTEVAECGLAALAMVANYHGLDIGLQALRARFGTSLRGVNLKQLMQIGDAIGFTTRPVKADLVQLQQLNLPAILHWDMKHFVVLEAVKRGQCLVHDPEGWSRWMSMAELSPHFTGIALELQPSDRFETGNARATLRLSQLWTRISGLKRAALQVLILSVVLQAFILVSPYYMQISLDSVLPALDQSLLTVLAWGFALFAIFNAIASLLRGFVLLAAGSSLGYGIAANVARRLFRLPTDWFERRHVGDILSRFQSILPIRKFLTEDAVAAVLDGSLALLTLVLMFVYSSRLALIACAAFLLYLLVRLVSFAAQRRAQESAMTTAALEQTVMIESVRGMTTLRLFNRESERHAFWQTRLNDATNAGIAVGRIGLWQGAANTMIFSLEMIVSVWLAVGMLIDGGFSTGMVFAYLAYKTQFLQKGVSLVDQLAAFRMLGLHLERLSDIVLTPCDGSFEEPLTARNPIKGRLELRDVGFRYSSDEPWVFRGLNLVVEAGEHLAISGPSGGGKTTLAKVMLGLLEPNEGEVLVDDIPLARYGRKPFHDQVAAVLQDDHLFAGTLSDNIALFDDRPDHGAVLRAAEAADLHQDIERMPMRYDTLVGDMGASLSGGQKQRLLLARALYRQPRMLLMDEATSHLDMERERSVAAAISHLGITRITIAHRQETLGSASRVVRLVDGCIAVCNAHNERSHMAPRVAPAEL